MGKLSSYSTEKSKDLRRVIYGQYNATIHLLTETKNLRKLSILLSLKSVCDSTGEKKRMISNVLISNTVLLQGLFFYFLISRESELKSLPNTSLVVAQTAKHLPTMWETQVRFLGWEDPLEKAMAPHSSTLAWKIPRTEYPGRLQSMGSQRVGHNWATSLSLSPSLKSNIHASNFTHQISILLGKLSQQFFAHCKVPGRTLPVAIGSTDSSQAAACTSLNDCSPSPAPCFGHVLLWCQTSALSLFCLG